MKHIIQVKKKVKYFIILMTKQKNEETSPLRVNSTYSNDLDTIGSQR
jgi:hypothetical protein